MCTSRLFPVAVGRERDTFGCAGCRTSLLTLFRSATINLMLWQNSINKELALHIHHYLASIAKSYNNTA